MYSLPFLRPFHLDIHPGYLIEKFIYFDSLSVSLKGKYLNFVFNYTPPCCLLGILPVEGKKKKILQIILFRYIISYTPSSMKSGLSL